MTNSVTERISALRKRMAECHVDYYLIPTDDFHGSEYVGDHFKCRGFVSGFTGSAGTLLMGQNWAGLWTDGRYFIQAAQQLSGSGIELYKMGEPGVPTLTEYLEQTLTAGQVLGFDGRTVNTQTYRQFKQLLEPKGVSFSCQLDLVGDIWTDRPNLSAKPVVALADKYAGEPRESKIEKLRAKLAELGADTFVLTTLDDIAWLLNIRGGDVRNNPVVLSFAAITADTFTLFLNPTVLNDQVRAQLTEAGVTLGEYNDVYDYVRGLTSGSTLLLDERHANCALLDCVPAGVTAKNAPSPTELAKAIKNPTELANIRQAHVWDGVAVTRFMYWLKHTIGKETITELSAAAKLESMRMVCPYYLGPSFDPIMSYGPHAAIVHYSPSAETDVPLEPRSFLLADTGGQYWQGTTDITRTFALGELTQEEKEYFTAVLQGHLNLANVHFRYGCTGTNLDYVARQPLWARNVDYNHGTGHGVGYLLNVHEGPQNFRWKDTGGKNGNAVLEPGMVTSNEPGFYLEGKFGIRHEDLISCVEGVTNEYGRFLHFDTLTMVPFDLDAIIPEQMSAQERALLNAYHRRVRKALTPHLSPDETAWLNQVTREI